MSPRWPYPQKIRRREREVLAGGLSVLKLPSLQLQDEGLYRTFTPGKQKAFDRLNKPTHIR